MVIDFVIVYQFAACRIEPEQVTDYGKDCSSNVDGCINSDTPYTDLTEAWDQCGKISGCGFVMRSWEDYSWNNKYYLRRLSDTTRKSVGVWGYIFKPCTT